LTFPDYEKKRSGGKKINGDEKGRLPIRPKKQRANCREDRLVLEKKMKFVALLGLMSLRKENEEEEIMGK